MNNRVKISITGKNPKYFLNELIRQRINLYYIEKHTNKIIVVVDYQDYQKIIKINTTNKISIISYYGYIKYKKLFRKYYLFFIFLLLGIMLNIILSNLILSIEVVHPNKKLGYKIINDLENLGIKKYHFKVNFKKREIIKEEILKRDNNLLEWIEIEEKGTKYIIRIEEKKKNRENKSCNYRNIIAKKKAVILDIKADSGEIVKNKYDYVNKGDVIISGFIHNKEDIISKRCAEGVVYGEVWYKVDVIFPKNKRKELLLNDKKNIISLKMFDNNIILFNLFNNYQKKDYFNVSSQFLPVNFSVSRIQKTKIINDVYKFNNVDKIALKKAEEKIEKQFKKEDIILSKKVLKKQEKNSKIIVEVFFKVKENITDYQDITNIEIN